MHFCSLEFVAFLAIVFAVYWSLPWNRARVLLLLCASFYFYACWNKWLALIVVGSSTFDYLLGLAIERQSSVRAKKWLVGASVVANLGLLCYFKYVNFFLDSLRQTLTAAGMSASIPTLEIMLPVGISFYTFEAISYVVDVYRGRTKAERNLANLLVFILFFPHLVAGPIVRARDFLPQIRRTKRWNWQRAEVGLQFFLMGLFKKWVIADHMALYADPVFADPGAFKAGAQWIAVLAYSIQIYCDFSGYTDMAIGTAHLFGFRLSMNFNMPYLAANVAEFWHRWHISLSSWLRDYLFIPLGGSRAGEWKTCRNLMVTMLLGGLWHGASWTFVAWGFAHGMLLIVHRGFRALCDGRERLKAALATPMGLAARVALTFLSVSLVWILFRAPTFGAAATMFTGMFRTHAGSGAPEPYLMIKVLVGIVAVCHVIGMMNWRTTITHRLPAPVLGMGYGFLFALCLVMAPPVGMTFIYFQF